MLTEKERARVYLALNDALNLSEEPQTEADRRKAGLAFAVARYAFTDDFPKIIAVVDALEIWTGGLPTTFDLPNVCGVTGLDRSQTECALQMAGAMQIGPLTWTLGSGPKVKLPKDFLS